MRQAVRRRATVRKGYAAAAAWRTSLDPGSFFGITRSTTRRSLATSVQPQENTAEIAMTMPVSTLDFRFPGVLNSKEMLVAEAIHARAWKALSDDLRISGASPDEAKARLGRIVTQLVGHGPKAVDDLAAVAVCAFKQESLA